jgi:biopolymer transport protein ExbB
MNLTQKFLAFTLLGAGWVLWLLVALSVLSVAVMIERWRYFASRRISFDVLGRELRGFLARGDVAGAEQQYGSSSAIEVVVGLAGLREAARGADAAAEAMNGARARQRLELERNLAFLGTLGNNAPFIGLFGTVLGIIKAFADLAEHAQTGAQAVMSGISEALVATADHGATRAR